MPSDAPDKSKRTAETQAREVERRKRLAAALRDNLRRRKGAPEPPPAPSDAQET